MNSNPNSGTRKEANRQTFETGDAEDQQTGTSQAQKGEGRKPAQSGKRVPPTTKKRTGT